MSQTHSHILHLGALIVAATVTASGCGTSPLPRTAGADRVWIDATSNQLPADIQPWGSDIRGEALYICRAPYAAPGREPGWHLGKFRIPFSGCHIGYGGGEQVISAFQMLSGTSYARWEQHSDGHPNDGSLPVYYFAGGAEGRQDGGQPLYVCRATNQSPYGAQLGKFRPEFKGCQFGFGGREAVVGVYELMLK